MKKLTKFRRIFAIMLAVIMAVGVFPITASAAKDKFKSNEISSVTITGVDAPKAGAPFDFDVQVNSQKYKVVKVAWKQQYSDNLITEPGKRADEGVSYAVVIILEVTSNDYTFKTTSGRTSAVTGTVNGKVANVDNAIDERLHVVDASKYDFDTSYKRCVRVVYSFPETETVPVESFNIIVDKPEPGAKPATKVRIDTLNGKENNGYINVDKVEWTLQNGDPMGDKFEFGETYLLQLTLSALYGRRFVPDPTNILSTKDNPMPKVNVTVNGESATGFPINGVPVERTILVYMVYNLNQPKKLEEINIEGISAPKTGGLPGYVAITPAGCRLAGTDSGTSKNGITWIEAGSSAIPTFGYSFEANTQYIVKIELEAEKGYKFDDPKVTIDGRTGAEVDGNGDKITVTYAFQPTGKAVVSSVGVEGIDAPKAGEYPDYTATLTDNRTELADSNDKNTENGIYWYNVTDKKPMAVGADKFEDGKEYRVIVEVWVKDTAVFDYKGAECNVKGYVNGKVASDAYGRSDSEVFVEYTFPAVGTTAAGTETTKPGTETTKPGTDTTKPDTRKAVERVNVTGIDITPDNPENPLDDKVKVTPTNTKITSFKWNPAPVGSWKTGVADIELEAEDGYKFTEDTVFRFNGYYAKITAVDGSKALVQCTFKDVFKEDPANHFHTHFYGHSGFEHWLECECGTYTEFGKHSYGADGKCTVCGYKDYDTSKLQFTDVKADDYFAKAVAWAFDTGVTTGTSATTFSPDMTCSRGQVVTFLWRAAGCPEPKSSKNPFTDVKEGIYYHKAVLWAVEQNITKGTSAKTFSPDMTCSTADILTFLFRAVGAGKDGWYLEAADWAAYNDLIEVTGLAVNPQTPCPRSAVVSFLYSIYG